jgi:hypothetical protein
MSSLLVFNRVYILEIQSVMVGSYDPSCKLAPLYLLYSSPNHSPPPPPPCVNKYRVENEESIPGTESGIE